MLVDLSVAIVHVAIYVAIIQLEVSVGFMQVTVSASKMWVTIFIVFMQLGVSVVIIQVALSEVHFQATILYSFLKLTPTFHKIDRNTLKDIISGLHFTTSVNILPKLRYFEGRN